VPTLVIDRPLRSGQQVYARGGDLVVMAAVNFGAEVIADGHIHVYAPLRGRAIAGARGNTAARIFSTCMEPQLVAIAARTARPTPRCRPTCSASPRRCGSTAIRWSSSRCRLTAPNEYEPTAVRRLCSGLPHSSH
jgi:septum formation inhibitor MinC